MWNDFQRARDEVEIDRRKGETGLRNQSINPMLEGGLEAHAADLFKESCFPNCHCWNPNQDFCMASAVKQPAHLRRKLAIGPAGIPDQRMRVSDVNRHKRSLLAEASQPGELEHLSQDFGAFFEITEQFSRPLQFPVLKEFFFFGKTGKPLSPFCIRFGVSGFPPPYCILRHPNELAEFLLRPFTTQFLHSFSGPLNGRRQQNIHLGFSLHRCLHPNKRSRNLQERSCVRQIYAGHALTVIGQGCQSSACSKRCCSTLERPAKIVFRRLLRQSFDSNEYEGHNRRVSRKACFYSV